MAPGGLSARCKAVPRTQPGLPRWEKCRARMMRVCVSEELFLSGHFRLVAVSNSSVGLTFPFWTPEVLSALISSPCLGLHPL